METWTTEEVQQEMLKGTQDINGQEYMPISRMVEILTDPRMPDHLKEKSTEMLKFLEKVENDLNTKKN